MSKRANSKLLVSGSPLLLINMLASEKAKEEKKKAREMLKRGIRYQSRGLLDEDDLVKVEDNKVGGDGQHLYMERTKFQIAEDFLNRNVNSLTRSLFGGATPINGPDALIRNS